MIVSVSSPGSQSRGGEKLPPLILPAFPPGCHQRDRLAERGHGQRRRGRSPSRPPAGSSSRPAERRRAGTGGFSGDAAVSRGNTDRLSRCLRDSLLAFLRSFCARGSRCAANRAVVLLPLAWPSRPAAGRGARSGSAGRRAQPTEAPSRGSAGRRWSGNCCLLSHRVFLGHVFRVRVSPASLVW